MIEKICETINCTGCSACASVCPQKCIQMLPDKEGFLRPVIDNDVCIKCKKCIHTCPINNIYVDDKKEPLTFAARHRNNEIVKYSSSGGAFSALCTFILENDGLVFGAGFDSDFNVIHKSCLSIEQLDELRRSKYVQSNIGTTYCDIKNALKKERRVLFCGTPCQVYGLKSFLGKEYHNLFTVDFICHGVPSPKVWKKYLVFREKTQKSQISDVSFRNKETGWQKYSLKIAYKNDTEYSNTVIEDMYLRSFIMNMDLRPSCYHCSFKKIHRESDITLADFWGLNMSEYNDDKGVSCIMVHSKKGEELLESSKKHLGLKQMKFEEALRCNLSMTKSVIEPPLRKKFMRDIDKYQFDKLFNKYCSANFFQRIERKLVRYLKCIFYNK